MTALTASEQVTNGVPHVQDHTHWTVDDFLDRVAARTPTPGGGGVTGLAGALSCAMARMVAAFSVRKSTPEADRVEVERLAYELARADGLMRALITRDALAYECMVESARRMREDPSHAKAHEATVLDAIGVPMQMAATAHAALVAMDHLKDIANPMILSDLAIAAVLAEAVARSAGFTVAANIADVTDTSVRERIQCDAAATEAHCRSVADRVDAFVRNRIAGP